MLGPRVAPVVLMCFAKGCTAGAVAWMWECVLQLPGLHLFSSFEVLAPFMCEAGRACQIQHLTAQAWGLIPTAGCVVLQPFQAGLQLGLAYLLVAGHGVHGFVQKLRQFEQLPHSSSIC